jgi:hypothetical protein
MPSVMPQAPELSAPALDRADQGEAARRSPRRGAVRWRPTKRVVVRQLTSLTERSNAQPARPAIVALLKRIKARKGHGEQVDAAIESLLAEVSAGGSDRWLLAEAAAWAVAWRHASRHPGRSADFLTTLLGHASAASADLECGDAAPAAFVLTASRLLTERSARNDIERRAWEACEAEILRLVTSAGGVAIEGSAAIVSRVARWTHVRAAAIATADASRRPKVAFARKADQRWRLALATAARLLGPGGVGIPVGPGPAPLRRCCSDITAAAIEHGRKSLRKAVRLLQQPRGSKREDDALSPTLDDRHAAMAILRSGWQGRSVRVLLDYRSEHPLLEVTAGKRLLLGGSWRSEVALEGVSLPVEGPWQVTHFEEDEACITLVIAAPLAEGLRLERHVVLAPEDRVLLLADAVVDTLGSNTATDLRYRGSLQTANTIAVAAAEETRELQLHDEKPQALVMPLAFHEWSTGRATGSFHWDGPSQQLHLEHRSPVRRLFAPLWIDLDPRRFGSQVTWRQLTVADTRVILRPEQASAFRIQAGLTNWVLYRSLDLPRNRTFLGCNVSSFFRLGKLGSDGLVSQMAEW